MTCRNLLLIFAALLLTSCAVRDRRHKIVVSVPEQRMLVFKDGVPVDAFPVSTSKFGLGDIRGSNATPLGHLEIAKKIGSRAPSGAVFKSRKRTGEILPANAPGRDPIVTRILWLKGLEPWNRNAYGRTIYIHGTPEEYRIGTPASYGCIRMRSADVIALYDRVGVGARVEIVNQPFSPVIAGQPPESQTFN